MRTVSQPFVFSTTTNTNSVKTLCKRLRRAYILMHELQDPAKHGYVDGDRAHAEETIQETVLDIAASFGLEKCVAEKRVNRIK